MQDSETKGLKEREENTSSLLTTTLSHPLAGLPQSLEHLKSDPIVEECRVLLLSLENLDATGTFSLSSSSSIYMISGFVLGNQVCLAISRKQVPGPRVRVMSPAITKEKSIFWKPVTWHIVQILSVLLGVLILLLKG